MLKYTHDSNHYTLNQHFGAAEARRAHNPEVTRSKRVSAKIQTISFCHLQQLWMIPDCQVERRVVDSDGDSQQVETGCTFVERLISGTSRRKKRDAGVKS